jgi:hypothetical protein
MTIGDQCTMHAFPILGMAVAHSRYKFITVPLQKRLRKDRFNSETATWIQKWFLKPV